MRTFISSLITLIGLMLPTAMAAEELPIEDLEIQAKIERTGDFMACAFDSLWMMSGSKLLRVDPADNGVTEFKLKDVYGPYRGLAAGDGAVWIPDTSGRTVVKFDPVSNAVVGSFAVDYNGSEGSIGVGHGAIWVVASAGSGKYALARLSSMTGAVEAQIPVPRGSISAVADNASVWVTNPVTNELYRIDPTSNSIVGTTTMRGKPRFLTAGEGAVWVLNQADGTVERVDPGTGAVIATIETVAGYRSGGDIVTGGGYVWVTLKGEFPVVQIDPKSNTTLRIFKGEGMGDAIRHCAGSLWVSGGSLHRLRQPQ